MIFSSTKKNINLNHTDYQYFRLTHPYQVGIFFLFSYLYKKDLKQNTMQHFGMAMLWLCLAYLISTAFSAFHTLFNIYFHKMGETSCSNIRKAYWSTFAWQPVYKLLCFPIAGWLYMKDLPTATLAEALNVGLVWFCLCFVIELFIWVVTDHPWRFSFREFYLESQPWLTFGYLVILFSPLAGYCCL